MNRLVGWLSLTIISLLLAVPVALPQGSGYECPDGQDHRCSDGKFHAPDGSVQPEACDAQPQGPHKDDPGTMHDCDCERASDMCDTRGDVSHPGAKCKTYCRPKACSCASKCDS